jgi:hypothetical protein
VDERPQQTSQVARSTAAAANGTNASAPAKPRTAAEIERDIEATRTRLASTIDELGYRVKPGTIAKRGADRAKSTIVDDTGSPRPDRLAMLGGAVAAVIGFLVWRRGK